jgi:hypothetical protein
MTTGRTGLARAPTSVAWRGNDEPSLQELLDDPVMQAMMARDGVDRATLAELIADIRTRLAPPAMTVPKKRTGTGK